MNRLTIDQGWACIEITNENISSMMKRPACPSPKPPVVIGGILYGEYGMSASGVEVRTSGESVTGRLVDETLYVWLPGSRSFVRLLRIAFDKTLDGGDYESGASGVVIKGMHGHVVAASRATSVWKVSGLRWECTVPKRWKQVEGSPT